MRKAGVIIVSLLIIAIGLYFCYNTEGGFGNLFKMNSDETDQATIVPENPFDSLDNYAKNTPREAEQNLKALTEYLIRPATTDIQKTRVLFTWIATHIAYDVASLREGSTIDCSASAVLSTRKSICQGYSNLFQEMCRNAGLQCEIVIGYAKGYDYSEGDTFSETNHAWNAVKIDNNWCLFDVTWASGAVSTIKNKLRFERQFEPFWFNTKPKALIFTHFPQQSKWQLVGKTLMMNQFTAMQGLTEVFFKLGFNPDIVYPAAVSNQTQFVMAYPADAYIKVNHLPYVKNISSNKEIYFEIASDANEINLINNKKWVRFEKTENVFKLHYKPEKGKLQIVAKHKNSPNFSMFLEYSVE